MNNDREMNLIETMALHTEFTIFSQMLEATGISEILAEGGEYTIFAPINAAFAKLPSRRLLALLFDDDQTDAKNLVLFHVTPGRLTTAAHAAARNFPGRVMLFSNLPAYAAGPDTGTRNIAASNGIIHAIGTVLAPAQLPGYAH